MQKDKSTMNLRLCCTSGASPLLLGLVGLTVPEAGLSSVFLSRRMGTRPKVKKDFVSRTNLQHEKEAMNHSLPKTSSPV